MKTAIFTLLLFICYPANANKVVDFGLRGETMPYYLISTFHSQENESLRSFILRKSSWFHQFTKTSGFEACGLIGETKDGYVMIVSSNHSQISCVMAKVDMPGFILIDTIHSHPTNKYIKLNASDVSFLNGSSMARRYRLNQKYAINPQSFSETDLESKSGYLVANGRVLYQENKKINIMGLISNN